MFVQRLWRLVRLLITRRFAPPAVPVALANQSGSVAILRAAFDLSCPRDHQATKETIHALQRFGSGLRIEPADEQHR